MKLNKFITIFTYLLFITPLASFAATSSSKDFKGHRIGVGVNNVEVNGMINSDIPWSDKSRETFLEYGYDINGLHTINLRYHTIDTSFEGKVDSDNGNIDYYNSFRGNTVQAEYELGYTFGDANGFNIKPYGAVGLMAGELSMKQLVNGSDYDINEDSLDAKAITAAIGVRMTFDHLYTDIRFQTNSRDHTYLDDSGMSLSFGVKF